MSNELNLPAYVDYFRQLAVRHYLLKHDPNSENGGGKIGSKHFARWSADEVVTGLRSLVSFSPAALLLEIYEINTKGQSPYDIKGDYVGAFTVLASAKHENTNSELDAFVITEQIYNDILKQIWQDHYSQNVSRDTTPFKYFHIDDLRIMPTSKLFDNEFGWRIEFGFEFRKTTSISTPPASGTFT